MKKAHRRRQCIIPSDERSSSILSVLLSIRTIRQLKKKLATWGAGRHIEAHTVFHVIIFEFHVIYLRIMISNWDFNLVSMSRQILSAQRGNGSSREHTGMRTAAAQPASGNSPHNSQPIRIGCYNLYWRETSGTQAFEHRFHRLFINSVS